MERGFVRPGRALRATPPQPWGRRGPVKKRWPAANMRPPGRPDRAVPSRPGLEQGHLEWTPGGLGRPEGSGECAEGGGVVASWNRSATRQSVELRKASKPLPEHGLVVMHSSATKPAHVPLCAQHFGHLDGICRSWRADALVPRVSWMIRVLSALRAS